MSSVIRFLGLVYTERQCCNKADSLDKFGVTTHFWSDPPGVLRNLRAFNQSDIAIDILGLSLMHNVKRPLAERPDSSISLEMSLYMVKVTIRRTGVTF